MDMAATNAGLPDGGQTPHFKVTYDDSLSPADGLGRATALQARCEHAFTLITSWFAGVKFVYSFPIELRIMNDTGGASWERPSDFQLAFGWSPTVLLKPASGTPVEVLLYLLVSEVSEMFMASQDKGWSESSSVFSGADEGSKGEGLSRFLGIQFQLASGLGGTAPTLSDGNTTEVTKDWLNSARADYVNNNPDDTQPDEVTGCTTLFLFYLRDQLGFGIRQIIAAGASTLAGVYHNLTGGNDAWTPFINLVNTHYPPGRTYNPVGESIFPVPELTEFRWSGAVTCGYEYDTTIALSRPALTELDVKLTSDDPALVHCPTAVPIDLGAASTPLILTTTALPLPFTPRSVTVHAAYAGTTLPINVYVMPPQVSSISLDKSTVTCGDSLTATVTLNNASKVGPVEVDLLSSAPGFAPVQAKLLIPQDATFAHFPIATPNYQIPFKTAHSWIYAKYAGSSAYVVLTIKPRVLLGLLKSVTLFPKTVQGGGVSHGTVTLEEPVPVATKVLLEALDPAIGPQGPLPLPGSPSTSARVPAFVTIPKGSTTATFMVTTTRSNLPRDRRIVRISARAITVRYATLVID